MTDIEYTIRKICERRGVYLRKVESVAMSMRLAFGLPDLTPLLPEVANTFYFVSVMTVNLTSAIGTASPLLRLTNLGGGSAGNQDYQPMNTANVSGQQWFIGAIECDSMIYVVNGNTSGVINVWGTVFKITTGATAGI